MVVQAATTTSAWKKVVSNADTLSFTKQKDDVSVIIEARHYDTGWEIVKKYVGDDINFVEQYTAGSSDELKRLLAKLKEERDLSSTEIKTISSFRKRQLKLDMKRVWQERHVEKWVFAFNNNYTNTVTVHYGRTIHVDVIMEEKLKYIEEKLVMKLFETLGLDENEHDTELTIHYFSKKTTYFFENEEEDMMIG